MTVAALIMPIAGCDGPRGIPPVDAYVSDQSAGAPVAAATFEQSSYRLALGDKVKVTVFGEPDMSGEFQVNDNGNIAIPLAGDVAAVNRTTTELKSMIVQTLHGRYVKNPRVTVEISSYRPFNVIGEVKNAGQYPYRPGLTVRDAIAMAGGYTYRADTHTLYVRRAEATGEQSVNLDVKSAAVLPGDNIRVPERFF